MSDGTTTQGEGGTTQGSGQSTPPAWYAGLDAEHVGHIQTRGWDKLDPAAAALEAIKGHVAATRMVGVPENQLLRLPKEGDSEGWRQVWQRLGAPADPKGYEFEGIDLAGDSGATNSFTDAMRQLAASLNLPKTAASEVAKGVQKWLTERVASAETEVADNLQSAERAIKANWGREFEHFQYVAKQGEQALQQRLGERLGPQLGEALQTLREQGYGELVAELGRVVGAGLMEDRGGGSSTNPGGQIRMTVEMAQSRMAELMADKQWRARRLAGDTDAKKEFDQLVRILAGSEG